MSLFLRIDDRILHGCRWILLAGLVSLFFWMSRGFPRVRLGGRRGPGFRDRRRGGGMRRLAAIDRDAVSRALNRRAIEKQLGAELRRSRRLGQRLCVGLIEIDPLDGAKLDGAKEPEGDEAHVIGDKVLRGIAEAISSRLRGMDALGRFSGNGFLMVLPHTTAMQSVAVAERLNCVVQGVPIAGTRGFHSLSIGLTEASPEDDVITLIARADGALFHARRAGRNCWEASLPSRTFEDLPAAGQAPIPARGSLPF